MKKCGKNENSLPFQKRVMLNFQEIVEITRGEYNNNGDR